MLPYYAEQQPDARGYAANPAGSGYVDAGVGGFLSERDLLSHPSGVDARWHPLTADNMARFQVPTLRNVDKRPYPNFVKAHGHNGYFKSLKSIVHFYNTRDVLRRCGTNDPGEATTCWPALESTASIRFRMKSRRLSTENTVVIFRGSGGGAHATHCS
jgi:cytochrome c peroxidase